MGAQSTEWLKGQAEGKVVLDTQGSRPGLEVRSILTNHPEGTWVGMQRPWCWLMQNTFSVLGDRVTRLSK